MSLKTNGLKHFKLTILMVFTMGSTNITIEDIRKIFQDMFQQHQEAITKKQEEMFRSHENSIMQLISGNTTLKIRDLTISVKKLKI